jgi:copper chaperone CopZ
MTPEEKAAAGEPVTREVAPGLVMEKQVTTEADGRYLIYYNFRAAAAGTPTMGAVTLRVPEIVCDACAASIRQALSALPGLAAVDVDVPQKQVRVEFDPAQAGEPAVRAAIEQAGFDVAD